MKLTEITLTQFRTYQKQHLTLGPGLHFLVGDNGVGKTNFLEAIHVLGLAKSYKGDEDDLIRYEQSFAKVSAVVSVADRERTLSIILSDLGKKAMVNQTEIKRLSDYIGLLNVVAFTPDSMELIKGAPVGRRYFLDVFLGQSDKSYFLALSGFKHVLKQRNELLKQYASSHQIDEILLDVLGDQFAKAASEIVAKRAAFLSDVAVRANHIFAFLAGRTDPLELAYQPSIDRDFKATLQSKLKSDLHQGATLFGPHRDDFSFILAGKPAKDFASQGEQRLAILSLNLAMVDYMTDRTGEIPVLLLDDVFSELDSDKQNRLVRFLRDSGAQVIITTTSLFDITEANLMHTKRYIVTKGKIREDLTNGPKS
jgi:DNA replication and repair protein RecF